MKACSTIDNGRGVEGIFQILGTNLSVPVPNNAWAYQRLKHANPIWMESRFFSFNPTIKILIPLFANQSHYF